MGKAAMCLRMLQVMNDGQIYKISELADLLKTNPRNIIEYRKELEEAGYHVIGNPGRNGGYQLAVPARIPALHFTEAEKTALRKAQDYLSDEKKFAEKKAYLSAMEKIDSSVGRS